MRYAISGRALPLAAGVLLALAAGATAQQTAATQPPQVAATQALPNEVTIDNFTFAPATLTVTAGTEIIWINHDDEPHTITSADKAVGFKSEGLDTDEKFSFVFAKPGTYKYFCSIHPHMVGTIVVK
ncbi:MAG: cupredoxin family copper-binding protein [Alphaproteobacteria bacterium]|nr:cupredoxin family copper-binding protein [Alphaproteobacteria bacterium]